MRRAALASTVGVTILWIVFCLYHHAPKIEAAVLREAAAAVAVAGVSDVRLEVDGRGIVLEGAVTSTELRDEVARVVRQADGVVRVENRLRSSVVPDPEPVPPFLEIRSHPGGVTLRGPVATSAQRDELLRQAIDLFGVERVDDRLVIDATADYGTATASAARLLNTISQETPGIRVRLQGDSLRLSGTVASVEDRRRIEQQAQAAMGAARLFFSTVTVGELPDSPIGQAKTTATDEGPPS